MHPLKYFLAHNRRKIAVGFVVYAVLAVYLHYYPGPLMPTGAGGPIVAAEVPVTHAAVETAAVALTRIPPHAPVSLITEPDDGITAVMEAIDRASSSVDLVDYELEDAHVEQALVSAAHRGVAVRVLLQNLNTFGKHPNQAAFDFLKSHGVPVKWAPNYFALTHQKTLVVDGKKAYIMTFNFTPQYYGSSRDFAVVDSDPRDVSAIKTTFNADWNGRGISAQSGSDLVWSPGSAATMLALIESASTTLDIYNEEMADGRITSALIAAAKRGVDVRVDMTYATNWKSALNTLTQAGVHVRTYPSTASSFYIHAKAIIADGTEAFVGSENFSIPSLDSNRELGIMLTRPNILRSLEQTFEHDWISSRPYNVTPTKAISEASSTTTGTVVKLSTSGICHPPDDSFYGRTKKYTPYPTLQDCINAGGRLPAGYTSK